VEDNELRTWDAEGRTFVNMNTPEEYAAALQLEG
jgi:molybdopterin-guanine dinucleotide biosynthesis protein A